MKRESKVVDKEKGKVSRDAFPFSYFNGKQDAFTSDILEASFDNG